MRACVRACVCVRASSCTNTETSMARLLADVLEAVFDQPFDIQCPVLLLWLLALHARVHVSTCVRIYPHPLRMLRANHSPSTHARTHARAHPHMHMHTHAHTHTESEGSFSTLRNLLRWARTSCIFSPDPTPPTLAPLFTATPLPGPWPLSAVENSQKSGPWSLVIMCYYVQVLGTDLCAGTGRRLVIVACCCSPICCCCCRRCNTAR